MNYDPKKFRELLERTGHAPARRPGRPSKNDAHKRAVVTARKLRQKALVREFCEQHFGVRDPITVVNMMRRGELEIPRAKTG